MYSNTKQDINVNLCGYDETPFSNISFHLKLLSSHIHGCEPYCCYCKNGRDI